MLSEEILSCKHQGAETGCYQGTLAVEQDARHDDGQGVEKWEVAVNTTGEIDNGGRKANVAQDLKVSLTDIVDFEPQERKVESGNNEDAQRRSEQTRGRIGVNRSRLYTQDDSKKGGGNDDSELNEP